MERAALDEYLADYLQVHDFRDYCPNGLQVEGRGEIARIVTGVTASAALIEAAVADGADALIVHHGYFWRGEDARITGMRRRRIGLLFEHELNLFAYHLPLDAHPVLGNNAQLGRQLGLVAQSQFGDQSLGCIGVPVEAGGFADARALAQHVESRLNRAVTLVGSSASAITKIAWCSGGAQRYFEAAIAAGAQAYITGEISEPQAHLARECGVAYLACGHHASERYGAPAVGDHLAEQLGLVHQFIDIDNPA